MKIDTREFRKTLDQYKNISRRSRVEIVDTKAFFIARRAVVETSKADKGAIGRAMNRKSARIIGMLINKRRGQQDKKGLYGDEMAEMVATVKAVRLRAISFVKSGWIPAIKVLGPRVKYHKGLARSEEGQGIGRVHQIGKPKGSASPATTSFGIIKAIIKNSALRSKRTTTDSGEKVAIMGLQKAIDFETNSMREYIAMKMKQDAEKAGIKTR